jgi:hypothetical protein
VAASRQYQAHLQRHRVQVYAKKIKALHCVARRNKNSGQGYSLFDNLGRRAVCIRIKESEKSREMRQARVRLPSDGLCAQKNKRKTRSRIVNGFCGLYQTARVTLPERRQRVQA